MFRPTGASPLLSSSGLSWILQPACAEHVFPGAAVFRFLGFLAVSTSSSMPAIVLHLACVRLVSSNKDVGGNGIHLNSSLQILISYFSLSPENIPRETLMHFAVRQGLLRLTWFLLQQPGGRGALSIHNRDGATPVSLALERGYQKLHQLLTE